MTNHASPKSQRELDEAKNYTRKRQLQKAAQDRAVEPDDVVWLRDLDGTGSMHPCTPHDPGAIRYIREDLVVATWSDVA